MTKRPADLLPRGAHVGGAYRSATFTGKIVGVVKPGTTSATTEYAIMPDKDSRHSGEPSTIHRYGRHIHRIG